MKPLINVEKLRLKFPNESNLLFKDLDITINKGEKVLLLGPSGCGKSTLLQVLARIIPQSIEVPMKANTISLPTSTGYVFQDPDSQFCMPYVDEEIAFVLENLQVPREKMAEKITHYLQLVGLEKIDQHIKINSLSGGQKQRLALASVLALEPEVLFLDEPSAMLDPISTEQVWNAVKSIAHDKTMMIVEHKIDHCLELIERIIVFNSIGEVIVDGSKKEVMKDYLPVLQSHGIWYPGVWDEYLSNRNTHSQKTVAGIEPILELHDFKVNRKKEVFAYAHDVKVYPGEWITVVGENGAGKSTLLLGIMQLLKTSGELKLNGNQVKPKADLSKDIAFVFQNPEFQFVTHTVYDELAHSLRLEKVNEKEIEEKVNEVLVRFSLLEHRHKHPYQLSMGQKRRLSVASSMMNKQPILLLDEPTFGQDSRNTFELLDMLEKARVSGKTIMMITHDENIVKNFSTKTWIMSNGQLREETHESNISKKLVHN